MNQSVNGRSTNYAAASKRRVALVAAAIWVGLMTTGAAIGQAKPPATRAGDLQIGAGFLSGYSTNTQAIPSTSLTLPGFGIYSVFDKTVHWGAEASFRQISINNGSHISERTYEIGGRYAYPIGSISPYAKLLYGRGIYNYQGDAAKLAYNIYTGGAGADVRVNKFVNVRLDYEYQTWMSFPRGDLHPSVLSIGVAYHFPEKCGTTICY